MSSHSGSRKRKLEEAEDSIEVKVKRRKLIHEDPEVDKDKVLMSLRYLSGELCFFSYVKADIARNPNSEYYLYITILGDTLVGFNNLFAQKRC